MGLTFVVITIETTPKVAGIYKVSKDKPGEVIGVSRLTVTAGDVYRLVCDVQSPPTVGTEFSCDPADTYDNVIAETDYTITKTSLCPEKQDGTWVIKDGVKMPCVEPSIIDVDAALDMFAGTLEQVAYNALNLFVVPHRSLLGTNTVGATANVVVASDYTAYNDQYKFTIQVKAAQNVELGILVPCSTKVKQEKACGENDVKKRMGKQRTGGTVEPVAVELQVTAGMAEISTSSFAYLEVLGSLWGVRGRAWSFPTMLTETPPRMDTRTCPQSKRRSPGGGVLFEQQSAAASLDSYFVEVSTNDFTAAGVYTYSAVVYPSPIAREPDSTLLPLPSCQRPPSQKHM